MNNAIKYTYITVIINLFIAFLILQLLPSGSKNQLKASIDFIWYFYLNFGLGLLFLFGSSYFIGKKMDYSIAKKNRNPILTGMLGLMSILICGIFGASSVGFLEETWIREGDVLNAMEDYYFLPFFWVLVVGFIPTLISGAILGKVIAKKLK